MGDIGRVNYPPPYISFAGRRSANPRPQGSGRSVPSSRPLANSCTFSVWSFDAETALFVPSRRLLQIQIMLIVTVTQLPVGIMVTSLIT